MSFLIFRPILTHVNEKERKILKNNNKKIWNTINMVRIYDGASTPSMVSEKAGFTDRRTMEVKWIMDARRLGDDSNLAVQ